MMMMMMKMENDDYSLASSKGHSSHHRAERKGWIGVSFF
jgi:hypothetical protein